MILTTLWRNNQEKADVSELFCRIDETGYIFLWIIAKIFFASERTPRQNFKNSPYFIENQAGKTGSI